MGARDGMKKGALIFVTALLCGSAAASAPFDTLKNGRTGENAAQNAPLVTFAGNLFVEPCNPTCNYDSNAGGFRVWGPDNCTNPGHTEWFGVPFVSSVTGTPTRVSAALKLTNAATCPTNQITLSIYTDDCKGPRKRLMSGIATVPPTTCALTVAQLRHAPTLTAGIKYWVVASTTEKNPGFDAIWYEIGRASCR